MRSKKAKQERRRSNRRRAERLYQKVYVAYKEMGKKQAWKPVVYKDISGVGVGILVSEPLKVGSKIKVSIKVEEMLKPHEVSARVIWCQEMPPYGFSVGLDFAKPITDTNLINFLTGKIVDLALDRRQG